MVSKMARDLGFMSPLTFIQENGRPLNFFMKPCSLRKKLSRIIEKGGGILTSELTNSEEIIRLTDPEKPVEGFVSSDFVFDSIEKKVLQDIDQYRIMSKKKNQTTEIVRSDNNEDSAKTVNRYPKRRVKVVDYEEMSDNWQMKTKKKKKRIKYTYQDDAAILKYLEEEDGYNGIHKLHGILLWKQMARKKVTKHTWQSMRNHFIDILEVRNNPQVGQKTLKETYLADCDSSGKDDIVDSDSDIEVDQLSRQRRKEHKEQSRPARGKHKASTSNEDTADQRSGGITTRDRDSTDDQYLTSGQQKASSSNNDTDDQISGEVLATDNEPLKNKKWAVNRRREKVVEPETDEQSGSGRAITRRRQKALKSTDDTDDHRVVTRKQGIKTHVRTEVQAMNKKEEKNEEVQESESDDEPSPDTVDEYSEQVPRQVTPVFPRGGVPSLKGKTSVPNKEPHLYPNIRVTIANHQDEVERDSDPDEFDQRLLSLAEKASFDRNCQESQDQEEGSEDETSAKDTQEDGEDKYIFRSKNRRKRTERNKNQGILSAKRKCPDNEDKRTLRVTGETSSTEKSSVNQARGYSASSSLHRKRKGEKTTETCSRNLFGNDADGHETVPRSAKGINRKDAATAKTPDDDEMVLCVEKMVENFKKIEETFGALMTPLMNPFLVTLEQLNLGEKKKVFSLLRNGKLSSVFSSLKLPELNQCYQGAIKLTCIQGMTRSQLLHALYVSNGVLKDTESYIKTGKLTNGARPWCREEDDILMRNDRQIVKTKVMKRSQSSVRERKAFLRSCK